ncbi:amino acid synthesis family protein [Microtetraspora malaysiensis]|uniref:amino acid synthesis family protein n=1 Tax=Microtetraspora malaysiensis TaxID=161358 RepID=UPI003D8FC538
MSSSPLIVRKIFSQVEETRLVAGAADAGGPLRKVAVCAVLKNPYAGKGFVEDLSELVDASQEVGALLGAEAVRLLGAPVESYGKGGLVGTAGEQEHINAALTSVFGNAFREAIGGGKAWITSATKVSAPGAIIDVPLAFKDEVWVRSHYDAFEVRIPDAPLADELVVIAAVANRGRINARVGGLTVDEFRAGASS